MAAIQPVNDPGVAIQVSRGSEDLGHCDWVVRS